ncbi:MAG: glycoside hydrolase [Gammaproteobacteria bacterium]|nr:glycoside hydrolase [Gammaproteobacteria bacterium]
MSDKAELKVVLCWHMHQPCYLDRESGQYQLPWTYLHAIKDYVDMAAVIEATPGARAVVNFAPTLLEQIDDYAVQVKDYLTAGTPLRDPLLAALANPILATDAQHHSYLIMACLRANGERLIKRYPAYQLLADLAQCVGDVPGSERYLGEEYLADLLTWYHLAWLGETVRLSDQRVQALIEKESGFTPHDRRVLLEVIGELLAGVIGRYRRLAENGQLELSVTPYAHPIIPLLLDLKTTHEAMPDAPLPATEVYPGGEERVQWHIREGNRVFEQHFGFTPAGCWPSEGAVSRETLKVLAEQGYQWAATGESVLRNSLARLGIEGDVACLHRPYRIPEADIACFFRDDGLSDAIGFTYADWHADDAVNNMVHHLENIAEACRDEGNRVVPIILDGENAWEYYPENGYHFLTALYSKLAAHPQLQLTTFSDCLAQGTQAMELPELVAGSWVYGSFSTWIGEADKNRGWDLLCDAKHAYDHAVAEGRLSGDKLAEAERQLGICEGSDWFWWFGDYNPAESVKDFDRLYRLQLVELYRLIGTEPPEQLAHVISHGGGKPQTGGVMRKGKEE